MYGFIEREEAQRRANELAQRHLENRYEVAQHRCAQYNIWTGRWDKAITWGVKCYVPYCSPALPYRLEGFVWFEGAL
jgi:hypothetical protein